MGKKDTINLIAKNKRKRTIYEPYRKLYSVHKWFFDGHTLLLLEIVH